MRGGRRWHFRGFGGFDSVGEGRREHSGFQCAEAIPEQFVEIVLTLFCEFNIWWKVGDFKLFVTDCNDVRDGGV